jgi:RNA polymerase sigma-70 factor (ECF subfamily)
MELPSTIAKGTPPAAIPYAWYLDHHPWLVRWLGRKLGCTQRAADIAHDTFVRVLLARDRLVGVHQPRAWLTTTAARLVVDEARRRRLEQDYLAALAVACERAEFPSPEQSMAAVQALVQLGELLDSVTQKARHVFLRHVLDGAPQSTVAAELNVSVTMVQRYLAQVLVRAHALDLAL